MGLNTFRPQGVSVLVAASSSTSVAATNWMQGATGAADCYVVNSSSAIDVYVAFGSSSIAAGCPTTATPCVGLALPPWTGRVFSVGPSTSLSGWISAVTSAGSAPVFATPGSGL